MAEQQGAMFDEFVQGGLLDDADVVVKSARFVTWDYRGKQSAVLALNLKLVDNEGTEHDEYLSSGELKFFVPSQDGKKAIPVGSQTKLNSNTNAAAFLVSLINADTRGELAKKIRTTDDISVLDNNKLHVSRKNQPKRSGIIQQPTEGGNARVPQRLEVDKVVAYAWESGAATTTAAPAAAAPASAAAPAAAAATASAANEGLAMQAAIILREVVEANGNTIAKSAIAGKVFNNPTAKGLDTPTRNAVLGLIVKPDFLGSETVVNMGMVFDGTNVQIIG